MFTSPKGLRGFIPEFWRSWWMFWQKPLSIICQGAWEPGEVPADWKLTKITPTYTKGLEERPGELQIF